MKLFVGTLYLGYAVAFDFGFDETEYKWRIRGYNYVEEMEIIKYFSTAADMMNVLHTVALSETAVKEFFDDAIHA